MKTVAIFTAIVLLFTSCSTLNTGVKTSGIRTVEAYNIIAFTGDSPSFTYPLDSVNFFIDNFDDDFLVKDVAMVTGDSVSFDNVSAAIAPFINMPDVINIIIYNGHGNSDEMEAGSRIGFEQFVRYLDGIMVTPTIVLIESCYSGNAGKFLKPDTKLSIVTATLPNTSEGSGSAGSVQVNMLGSLIYALEDARALDADSDNKLSLNELLAKAMIIAKTNSDKYGWYEGKQWARFGAYLWGVDATLCTFVE